MSDFRHQNAILHFVLRAHCATACAVFAEHTTSTEIESVVAEIDAVVDKDPPQARSVSCLPDAPFTPMTPRACACHGRPDVPPSSVRYARRASGQLAPTLAGCAPHQLYSLCSFPLVFFCSITCWLPSFRCHQKKNRAIVDHVGHWSLRLNWILLRDRRARPREQVAFRPRDGRPFELSSSLP